MVSSRTMPAARYDILAFSGTRATGQRTPARSTPQESGGPLRRLAYRTMTAGREGGASRCFSGYRRGGPGRTGTVRSASAGCVFVTVGDLRRYLDESVFIWSA